MEGMPKPERKEEIPPKDVFITALNAELAAMEQTGRISAEQAQEKREAAALIEEGFSDDPKHDALVFSRAGIAAERELANIFTERNQQADTSGAERQEHTSSIRESREGGVSKIDMVAEVVEDLIQEYAKILRGKWEENNAMDREDPQWGEKVDALFAAVSSLQEAQKNFDEAFERMRASGVQLDDTTVQTIIHAGVELGEKLKRLN